MREVILKNAAECSICHELIESNHVHEFRSCKCGRIAVDGGREYLRRLFMEKSDIIEHSQVEYRPIAQWLTDDIVIAMINSSGLKSSTVVRKAIDQAFAFLAPHYIISALRELPVVKALSYDDYHAIENVIKKELTGKDSK